MTYSTSDYVHIDHDGGTVATVVIKRYAKRNALDRDGWHALSSAFTALGANRNIRCMILTGVPGAFCAGDDIQAFAAVQGEPEARQHYWNTIMECYAAIKAMPFPVIAAIDGPCVGGGCTLALYADFRIVGPQASFSVPPAKLGLVYPAESTALLAHIAGDTFARYMLYSGATIDAARAVQHGLAWSAEGLTARHDANILAQDFAASAPKSVHAAKLVFNSLPSGNLNEIRGNIEQLSIEAERSKDRMEGLVAFREKRFPRFLGE